jgi:hypothetical protein
VEIGVDATNPRWITASESRIRIEAFVPLIISVPKMVVRRMYPHMAMSSVTRQSWRRNSCREKRDNA